MHCLRPSAGTVAVFRVKRSTVRKVSVPFCEECLALREHKSHAQIQVERIATVVSFLLSWAAGIWTYLSVLDWPVLEGERSWVWAVLLGALSVAMAFGTLYLVVRPLSRAFRSPETKAVLASVRIRSFDWETTTLEFADEGYAERFARVNRVEKAAPPREGEARPSE